MTTSLSLKDIHTQLRGFYNDLERLQARMWTQHAKTVSLMHEVKELADEIKMQLEKKAIGDRKAQDLENEMEEAAFRSSKNF